MDNAELLLTADQLDALFELGVTVLQSLRKAELEELLDGEDGTFLTKLKGKGTEDGEKRNMLKEKLGIDEKVAEKLLETLELRALL